MNVKIRTVRHRGDLLNERLVLHILADTEIGSYAVFNVEVYEGGDTVSNKIRNAFWFPDKRVAKGDLVVLYTKDGVDKDKVNKNGTTTHFFYWERKQPVWNKRESAVVIIEAQRWISQILSDDESEDQE